MNGPASKYLLSASLMGETLLRLLSEKDFQEVTVKEVCRLAGVNRSTFYLHYDNLPDLLTETIEQLMEQLKARYERMPFPSIETADLESLILFRKEYVVPYLEYVKEYRHAFKAAFSKPQALNVRKTYEGLYERVFEPILVRYGVKEKERRYMIRFYMSGIHQIIEEWVENNCLDDAVFISDIIVNCINKNPKT